KKAKLKIENAYEKRLIGRGNGGDIFALKQFGWKDKQETKIEAGDSLAAAVEQAWLSRRNER
ncbi:hypothetical protein, partial [Christensenella minuta]